jgi:small subunit ribosomal protein S1
VSQTDTQDRSDASAHSEASAKDDTPAQADQSQNAESAEKAPKLKTIVKGVISKQVRQMAFVILESGQEAYINISELAELRDESGALPMNLSIEAEVVSNRSGIKLSREYIARDKELDTLEAAFNAQTPVEGRIKGVNKGGFEIRLGNINAFCPRSRFSQRREGNPKKQVGKVMLFMIEEFKREGRTRVVVTRLPILERESQDRAQMMGERFKVGDVIKGQVTQLVKFGAFVNVGEQLEGLIPMSELRHDRVEHASDVVTVNDSVEVKVIGVDVDRGRLSLSLRAMTPDAWEGFVGERSVGDRISGTVVRLTDFGAFVELAPKVEGLVHISAITTQGRLNHPSEKLSEGQTLDVIIEEIVNHARADKRRIRLMTPEVAERRAPINIKVSVGDVLTVPVKSTQERGITVTIATGLDGFIPAPETGTPRGSNLQERFPVGSDIQAKVLVADLKRRKVKLSIKALENHEEEMAYKAFRSEMKTDQARMRSTFGDLFKNL